MFDPRRDQPTISFPIFDGVGHRIHGNESKVKEEPGICSTPLWTRSPPTSPHQKRNYYRSLSPSSKTQAIERGQRELMEMVKNMPESCYELTLKDIVEPPKVDVGEENKVREKNLSNKNVQKREGLSIKVDKKGSSSNNNKIDSGGLYLKMVFPTSLGSKKHKKKVSSANNNSSKVSPRPSFSDVSSNKGIDKDWWKKSLSASAGDSDSGVSSMNSGSMKSSGSSSSNSSRSNSRHKTNGGDSCWPFIRRPKSLSQK
ncbi:hypothetical protein Lal_00024892 [Lupinus albus]|uniref:Uncharacterized protein n=1 Tax=Lupinus albus TaxID=3870 RepID=A0A6A5NXB3_LUPAL|nr:hypothetical protein Lalb_Chr10g0101441 [Lupinus albus]KAF1889565.1 hypothetical protein Lal_00024892 [Lupinus albus]